MNIFKKLYCRTFQFALKVSIPLLPYHEPKILSSYTELIEVLKEKNIGGVLLVTDGGVRGLGLTKDLEELLSCNFKLEVFDKVQPNPTSDLVEEALEIYKQAGLDAIVAFGGGSPIDAAKGVAARVARPKKSLAKMKGILKVRKRTPLLIVIPTTAGTGSETTLAAVITDSKTRHKYAINDFPLIPDYAGLFPELTVGLPKQITATTGMDALTHAVEAYIGGSTTASTRKHAKFAVKIIFENLELAYADGKNLQARDNMLHAAYSAGVAFTKSYVGYVHAIAHSLGGKYNVAHGLANAVILPYVLKAYGKKIYKKLWELGVYAGLFDKKTPHSVGAKIFIEKIEDMNKNMSIPTKISEIQEEDIPALAKTAEKEGNPLYPVPVLWGVHELEKIYFEVKDE